MPHSVDSFRVSSCCKPVFVWLMLVFFISSFVPAASFAQQPTATISSLNGKVSVSGQAAAVGTVLQSSDTIQVESGASVILTFSDGSEVYIGENTQITISDLSQTPVGARISSLTLLYGRLRAFLSQEHQQEGSAFTVETPNAQLGVKFSEPDIEVSYDPDRQETIGIAHTVALIAKNLLTNEELLVPVGSTVIITTTGIKIVAGIVGAVGTSSSSGTSSTSVSSTGTTSGSMGTGTKVAIGAGALAVGGGAVALAISSSSDSSGGSGSSDSENSFTGRFVREWTENEPSGDVVYWIESFELVQSGNTITGTMTWDATYEGCCNAARSAPITGEADGTSAICSVGGSSLYCEGGNGCVLSRTNSGSTDVPAELVENGSILRVINPGTGEPIDFIRQ